jgi:hypothetical protein
MISGVNHLLRLSNISAYLKHVNAGGTYRIPTRHNDLVFVGQGRSLMDETKRFRFIHAFHPNQGPRQ